jgi:late competence protein required for DNA uptake (superfamily II DNA/RNA helicase)
MKVVVYKAQGKTGDLFDISFNPLIDFEILKNTRNIEKLEILTPKVSFEDGERILKNIYGESVLNKIIIAHDYYIKHGIKKFKTIEVIKTIKDKTVIPSPLAITKIEECITGKVVSISRLLKLSFELGLTEDMIMDIIQILYCERRIRMIPAIRKKRKSDICTFCEKEACNSCSLGFRRDDILLYAADNYNIGVPRTVEFKKKKLSESLDKAMLSLRHFLTFSKKKSAVLWCVPGSFDYFVIGELLSEFIKAGGKILYITAPCLLYEVEQEINNIIEDVNISTVYKDSYKYRDSDIIIASYSDYQCFHKAFDLVIYDDRMAFTERPLENMLSITSRAVKEKGRFLNITCFPDLNSKGYLYGNHTPEVIVIPVSYSRSPIPEPLIVLSRLLKVSIPQIVIDTVKWTIEDKLKVFIFVPNEESMTMVYDYLVNFGHIKNDLIDFSSTRDKTAIIKLKRREIQIIISNDFADAKVIIEDLNVVVINADNNIYNKDTLLYMASMANYHSKKKCGQVLFAVEKDNEIVNTTKEKIRGINKIAWESGYLRK